MVQATPVTRRTALIVESDETTRELLRLHLLNAGYQVLMAADAIVAGRTLLRMAADLQVLIVDTELPYLSGIEFVSTLIADTTLPYVPIIMLAHEPHQVSRTGLLGVPCLEMPISADTLLRHVRQLTEQTVPLRDPAGRESMQAWLERSERRHKLRDAAGRPLRLVVADDEPDTVTSLMTILHDEGHSVLASYRGSEVIPAVRKERPDAVILDIDMPGLSGYAVAKEIRGMFDEARCPLLIAISGKWMSETDRLVAEVSGFHHFLLKPCQPGALLELLQPLRT